MLPYVYFSMIMHVNIFILVCFSFFMIIALFISPLVLQLSSRMELSSVRCAIYWRQPMLSPFICMYLSRIGVIRFYLPVTLSTVCPPLSWVVRFLIVCYFRTTPYTIYLPKVLVVLFMSSSPCLRSWS